MNDHSEQHQNAALNRPSLAGLLKSLVTAALITSAIHAIANVEYMRLTIASAFHEDANTNRQQLSVILEAASNQCGLVIDVFYVPWARMLHSVQHGHVDGIITVPDYTEQATNQFPRLHSVLDVSRAILYNSYRLYSLSSIAHSDVDTLEGQVGIERDNHSRRLANSLNLNTFEGNAPESLVLMLLRERLDYLLVNEAQFENVIARLDSEQRIQASSFTFPATPFYIAFSEDFYSRHRAIAHCIWDSIQWSKATAINKLSSSGQ
ncbi:MAG: transporter substrate-binding domain-containing protein [Saccharospirillum sp.]|nr:transporter substrate-binding domain-containing protein [Saccharospirillum sp.]